MIERDSSKGDPEKITTDEGAIEKMKQIHESGEADSIAETARKAAPDTIFTPSRLRKILPDSDRKKMRAGTFPQIKIGIRDSKKVVELTEKQKRVLDYLEDHNGRKGRSIPQVGREADVSSNTVRRTFDKLEKKNYPEERLERS